MAPKPKPAAQAPPPPLVVRPKVICYFDYGNHDIEQFYLHFHVNNLVSLKGPKDVSDSLRTLDRLKDKETQGFHLAHGLDLKLSAKEKEAIYANRIILLLHANKIEQARKLLSALPDMFPEGVTPVLLQAALLGRENKAGRDEEILAQFASKFPEKSEVVHLAQAQVAAGGGRPHIAADSLAKISDIQHMPATVAILVSLKERAGDIDGAAAVLDAAKKWWSSAMTEDNKLNIIMQEAASFKLRHGREEDAAQLFEELVKSQGSIEVLVGLVTTVAPMDVVKAELYEKQLKTVPGLKGIHVDSLKRTSGVKQVEGLHVGVPETYEEGKNKTKTKKKRKRKPRYPQGFDPANPGPPPDPERWLRRERDQHIGQRGRTKELLKLEGLRVLLLKKSMILVPHLKIQILSQSREPPKVLGRMQLPSKPSLHPNQERSLGIEQDSWFFINIFN
ncbi:hypothetical protein Fmac_006253 [Flemingia macrophylla]|uniref:Signal recognition particle subunit SRP72 n=1 Tax=Flemingia macrophylla TaxID=520843 RepID=A0ABD1NA30_9FABA